MKMLVAIPVAATLIASVLSGCAAIQPSNPAVNSSVIATPNPPPKNCKYLGQVLGSQGNFFTGRYTSNANLEQGAMNDLKNKTYEMGGNYVQLVTNRAGVTGSTSSGYERGYGLWVSGHSEQTNVTSTGNAYKCPPHEIGLEGPVK